MEDERVRYGIWGGRFQIIHKGHEFVLDYVNKKYSNVCIGIVNPDPKSPPWSTEEHERFIPEKNPFTYFERLYLWDKLLKSKNIEAVIVPHWHPRKSLKLESTFLPWPKDSREWVVPLLENEDYKVKDLKKLGEHVNEFDVQKHEPDSLRSVHSSYIINLFNKNDDNYKSDIPQDLRSETDDFLNGRTWGKEKQFIVVPIIGDELDPMLICGGIQQQVSKESYERKIKKIIFAPIVKVRNIDEWWKDESIGEDFFTFYQKHEIINHIMKRLDFNDYYVSPIIVKNNQCQAVDSFLPGSSNRSWILEKGINLDSTLFKHYLRSEHVISFEREKIPQSKLEYVGDILSDLYTQMNYNKYRSVTKGKEENQMSKYNFNNAKIGFVEIVEKNEGGINQNNYLESISAESMISDILRSSNEIEFNVSVRKANEFLNKKSEKEIQATIDGAVKRYIDSAEENKVSLKKIKQFCINIANNMVATLLFQTLDKFVF